jgi:sodium/hydrogen antiporter
VQWALAIVALTLLAVTAVSKRLSGTPVTPAMVFVAVGVLAGPGVFDEIDTPPSGSTVRVLAEATLALVLFYDASRINLVALRRELQVPVRLLGIGLPLTIAAGALAAVLLFGQFTPAEALVLAVLLAPTDAALGQAVVTEPRLPSPIRQGLNVESGLNDGICVPLLLIVLAGAEVEAHVSGGSHAIQIVAEEIGYGAAAGVVSGALAAAVILVGGRLKLIAGSWLQIVPVAGAFLAYGLADPLGGSGFIAAFVAGMTFGAASRRDPAEISTFSEQLGQLLNGVTFLGFGAILLGPALGNLSWRVVLYAVVSLTIVRMLPVAIATAGLKARGPTVAFLGWFGPRGLASIVFGVVVVEESHLPHVSTILLVTYITVGLSVLLHGISAAPLAGRYVRWLGRTEAPSPCVPRGPRVLHTTGDQRPG